MDSQENVLNNEAQLEETNQQPVAEEVVKQEENVVTPEPAAEEQSATEEPAAEEPVVEEVAVEEPAAEPKIVASSLSTRALTISRRIASSTPIVS